MNSFQANLRKLQFPDSFTAGWMAMSALLVCGISGILLAIPYDISKSYESLFELHMTNPAGVFVRNLHYWSAQLALIFTLIHFLDHFYKSTDSNIKSSQTWFLLWLGVCFLCYLMLSGFILKGDAAGLQARRILESMLSSIPFFGNRIARTFAGTDDSWQIVYVQHISTGTILLFIGIYGHLKKRWPASKIFLVVLAFTFLLSLVFRAPMGMAETGNLKGPWFFQGIQEMLHWSSTPVFVLLLWLIVPACLILLPAFSPGVRSVVKKALAVGLFIYLLLTLFVLLFRGENWEFKSLGPNQSFDDKNWIFHPVNLFQKSATTLTLTENKKLESCLLCHSQMTGLSTSHNPASTGCYACHKGDPLSPEKQLAHRNMILNPGNFSNVSQTCGTQNCHPDITARMMRSLMTTSRGILAVDKFVFGETTSPDDSLSLKNLANSSADTHFRNLCAGCHLGKDKTKTGNPDWLERGGGCSACHLFYNNPAEKSRQQMSKGSSSPSTEIHPLLDIRVTNDRCKSCHSRSGRISLNYEGWNETDLTVLPVNATDSLCKLPDNRILRFVQSDIHHQKGMACIDCHGSYELMGDGRGPKHKEEAVSIQCLDCHPTQKPKTSLISDLPDRESQMISWLRKYSPQNRVIVTAKNSQPLLNTLIDSMGSITLVDKLTGKKHLSKNAASVCTKGCGHRRLSCESCHTAWVPQCLGCHTTYESKTPGFDLENGRRTKGAWVEFAGKSYAEPPVLGVSDKAESKIVTTMPGMILTIDKGSFEQGKGTVFRRLYAPASGHTTQKASRSCKSCHNNPLAIGFGRGELNYRITGQSWKWTFVPAFANNPNDGLPEDAWTGFLREAVKPNSTRIDLRPFSVKEQKKILVAGSCLTCHDEKSNVADAMLTDFDKCLNKRLPSCILPSW